MSDGKAGYRLWPGLGFGTRVREGTGMSNVQRISLLQLRATVRVWDQDQGLKSAPQFQVAQSEGDKADPCRHFRICPQILYFPCRLDNRSPAIEAASQAHEVCRVSTQHLQNPVVTLGFGVQHLRPQVRPPVDRNPLQLVMSLLFNFLVTNLSATSTMGY